MPTPEEIKKMAHEYGVLMAKDIPESNCLKNEVINSTEDYIIQFLQYLCKDYCIVSREFIKRQRLIIEFDKKQMLEKPISEKIALAGVYQAKLELMDKLFGKSLFGE